MSPPPSTKANGNGVVTDKRDFDANRPLLRDGSPDNENCGSGRRFLDDDESFMNDVVDGIIERDRKSLQRSIVKAFSFFCAILSWYVNSKCPWGTL